MAQGNAVNPWAWETGSAWTRNMIPREGMLIGSQAKGFFFSAQRVEDSPTASRPSGNAGAVHDYIRVGEKTRYLSG